jgi:hypothetical protein
MKNHSSRAFFVLGLSLLLQTCGGDNPSGPGTTANPTPTPVPTATAPTTLGRACGAAPMPDCAPGGCCRIEGEEGQWESQLWSAIQLLQDQQPALFNGQKIVDRERFLREVARIAEQQSGLCVLPGPNDDEVGVKSANGVSEQYDIYESSGRLRYPGYDGTCRPARF